MKRNCKKKKDALLALTTEGEADRGSGAGENEETRDSGQKNAKITQDVVVQGQSLQLTGWCSTSLIPTQC